MFQRFHLFLASLVMSRKNIRLKWFGRGNIDDIETVENRNPFEIKSHTPQGRKLEPFEIKNPRPQGRKLEPLEIKNHTPQGRKLEPFEIKNHTPQGRKLESF